MLLVINCSSELLLPLIPPAAELNLQSRALPQPHSTTALELESGSSFSNVTTAARVINITQVATRVAAQLTELERETFVVNICPVSANYGPTIPELEPGRSTALFVPLHNLAQLKFLAAASPGAVSLPSWLTSLPSDYNRQGETILALAGLVDEAEIETETEALGQAAEVRAVPLPSIAACQTQPPLATSELVSYWGDAGAVVIIPPPSPALAMFLGHAITHLLAGGDIASPI